MTTEILFKFAKKNINLSPEAYQIINGIKDPLDFSSSLIVKLKSQEFSRDDLVSLNLNTVEEFMKTLGLDVPNQENDDPNSNSQKTLLSESDDQIEVKLEKNEVKDQKNSSEIKAEIDTIENNSDNKLENYSDNNSKSSSNNDLNNNLDNNSENSLNYNSKKNLDNSLGAIKKIKNVFSPSECKRNLNPSNKEFNYKTLQDTSKKSYTSGKIGNLITYFQNRYSKLSSILAKRPELKTFQKISDLEEKESDLNLIVMVREIRSTKNGHKIIVFEDDTDEISVLFHKDNNELFRESEKLVKDEVIGLLAEIKGDLAIASRIIQPGVPRIANKTMDFSAVFTSDIHIGSLTFLEDAFVRFTKWLNGDYGTEEQRKIGNDVKYLIVGGDIVDGIGVYPNQDKELSIKDITDQYEEAARLLGDIRSDAKIIIAPGNHDASRVAEPQPAIPEKYAKSLHELDNVEFVSNPAIVSLDGWNTLIYHGRGFDDIAITVKGLSHERNDLIMEELLNKRHLAPIYGERTPLASELEDHLVIDNVPDIFHTGHVHINTYKNYKGIHMINSGTFQTQTEFQKVHNILPTCAEVPILHRGVYKKLKFI
ncbi:DNA polymerase II small subunit [Candidatus Methanobinarius endosymbioticus]|uniref:DNA polymerase II small subunit n=1 Tax=Candidatus Methanobinarius endosymbioticus TaxID=2006182 RepID=A0A366M9F0_9EURY|nr:DNA polymerase II small subunit [Candidatus Methanobinarius endosymbioticus]